MRASPPAAPHRPWSASSAAALCPGTALSVYEVLPVFAVVVGRVPVERVPAQIDTHEHAAQEGNARARQRILGGRHGGVARLFPSPPPQPAPPPKAHRTPV